MKKASIILSVITLSFWREVFRKSRNAQVAPSKTGLGAKGVLEVYSGGKRVKRFVKSYKLSTDSGINENSQRPDLFGYGVVETNVNGKTDSGEVKVCFEFSDYIFFENLEAKKIFISRSCIARYFFAYE